MFRPKSNTMDLVSPNENAFEYHGNDESVMQFIKLNKAIPNKLASFSESILTLEKIDELAKSIAKGDLTSQIYLDPDCQLYSLYLLKEKKIDINQFLDINIYLAIIAQYTDKQHPEDNAKIQLLSLQENEYLQNLFINQIDQHFVNFKQGDWDKNKLQDSIKSLNKLGDIIIRIEISENNRDDIVLQTLMISNIIVADNQYIYVPNTSLIRLFIETINPGSKLKMAPIYGTVNLHTLYLMHQKGFIPVNLFSPLVKSTPQKIHNSVVGAWSLLAHDIFAHFYWANFLPPNQYHFFYDYFIPIAGKTFGININNVKQCGGIFDLIDVNIPKSKNKIEPYNSTPLDKFNPKEFFLYFYIFSVMYHGSDEKTVQLFSIMYDDINMIGKKYGIGLETIFNHPFFNDPNNSISGKKLLKFSDQAELRNLTCVQLYEEKVKSMQQQPRSP